MAVPARDFVPSGTGGAGRARSRLIVLYDALYVALTEALSATLLTFDRKLAAAPGHAARVEVPA